MKLSRSLWRLTFPKDFNLLWNFTFIRYKRKEKTWMIIWWKCSHLIFAVIIMNVFKWKLSMHFLSLYLRVLTISVWNWLNFQSSIYSNDACMCCIGAVLSEILRFILFSVVLTNFHTELLYIKRKNIHCFLDSYLKYF